MPKVDVKMVSKKHNHKKAHETNSSRHRKQVREAKRAHLN